MIGGVASLSAKPTMNKLVNSTKLRVALSATAVALGIIALLSYLQLRDIRSEIREMVGQDRLDLVTRVAADLDDKLELRQRALVAAVDAKRIPTQPTPAQLDRLLRDLPALGSLFNNLAIAAPNGRLVAAYPNQQRAGVDVGDRDYFRIAHDEDRPAISRPFIGRPHGMPMVVISAPLRNEARCTPRSAATLS